MLRAAKRWLYTERMTSFNSDSRGAASSGVATLSGSLRVSAGAEVAGIPSCEGKSEVGLVSRRLALRGVRALAMGLAMLGVAGVTGAAFDGVPAAAQKRGPVSRTVQGKVMDGDGTVLKGAVVYLKDDKTLAVKSFIVDDDGAYRFGQLSQATDYELWAELDGKKSKTRAISSFDNNNDFVINLKVSK